MSIKKAYTEIVDLLEKNKAKKVSDIFEQVVAIASAKVTREIGSTYLKDDKDQIVAIRCWNFKRWMPLVGDKAVEFGKKRNTATGLNTMCKEGVRDWTKRQSIKRKAKDQLMQDIKAGKVKIDQIDTLEKKIEEEATKVTKTTTGFETKEQVIAYLKTQKVTVK